MGKIEQATVHLVSELPLTAKPGDSFILCPFLRGLDPTVAMWLGPLAWHDSNAALLDGLRPPPQSCMVFAAVFCAEPFRSADEILAPLRAIGITGVINLPSVSFLDGQVAQTLDALNLGLERELRFLDRAREQSFKIGCCLRTTSVEDAVVRLTPDLIISHSGPPSSGYVDPAERRYSNSLKASATIKHLHLDHLLVAEALGNAETGAIDALSDG